MIGRVVVLLEYRGKKIGQRVIREAEDWIRELGYETIIKMRKVCERELL